MSHTPGPWTVEGEGGIYMSGLRDAYQVVPANGPRFVLRTFNSRVPSEEQRSNAVLAASAPDLLMACEMALRDHQDFCLTLGDCPLTKRLNAAITRARGHG